MTWGGGRVPSRLEGRGGVEGDNGMVVHGCEALSSGPGASPFGQIPYFVIEEERDGHQAK